MLHFLPSSFLLSTNSCFCKFFSFFSYNIFYFFFFLSSSAKLFVCKQRPKLSFIFLLLFWKLRDMCLNAIIYLTYFFFFFYGGVFIFLMPNFSLLLWNIMEGKLQKLVWIFFLHENTKSRKLTLFLKKLFIFDLKFEKNFC